MNDKIKELALKANLDYDTHIPDAWTCESKDLERFARLIVEECAVIAWSHFMDTCKSFKVPPADSHYQKWLSSKSIRNTFGIE